MDLKAQNRWRCVLVDKEWMIRGKFGQITTYCPGELDVWIKNMRQALKAERFWPVKNSYDDGALFIRPDADLDLACRLIRAPKRRQVTEAMRETGRQLAARMRSGKQKPLLEGRPGDELLENGTEGPWNG